MESIIIYDRRQDNYNLTSETLDGESGTDIHVCGRRQGYSDLISETIDGIPDYCIEVDVLKAIAKLEDFEILERETCEMLRKRCQRYKSKKERLQVFVDEIPGSLEFLFHILDLIGLAHIPNAISSTAIRPIHRAELTHSRHFQLYFYQLKNNIDWKNFFDPSEVLEQKYNTVIRSFNDFSSDDDGRLKAAGRLAVLTWLRIQHCKRNTQLIRQVLNGMIENWPTEVDDTLAKIFYHSKMAIAAIMDGDVSSAEEHSRIAKHLSAPFHDPLTKALICHDSRYTNQRIFEYQRTERHRKAVFDETITGLCFLESDDNGCEKFNEQMKRMFLLYAAQYKLNIHNDLNSRESDRVSTDDIKHASNALECFKRTLIVNEPLDPRRGMVYMVCKARVLESKAQFPMANFLLSRATELAGEGAYYTNEAANIIDFTNRLLLRK